MNNTLKGREQELPMFRLHQAMHLKYLLIFIFIMALPMTYAEIPSVVIGSGTTILIVNTTTNSTASDTDWTRHDDYPAGCGAGDFVTAIGDTLTCSSPSIADTNESLRFGNLTATQCPANYMAVGVYTNGTIKCLIEAAAVDTWVGNFTNISSWVFQWQLNQSNYTSLWKLAEQWSNNQSNYSALWNEAKNKFNISYEGCLNNESYLSTFNSTYAGNLDTFAPNATGVFANLSINWSDISFDEWGVWWKNQTANLWTLFDARYWGINSGSYNATYDAKIDTFAPNATGVFNNLSINWTLRYNWSLPILNQINNTNLPSLNETYRTVNNNSFSGTILPDTTLVYDIGSGANRWSKLWVANISAENIDTFSLSALYNISAGNFLGNTSCKNITGAVSDLCTLTASGEESDPIFIGNATLIFANLSINYTYIVYTNWNTIWSSITNETYRTVDNFTGIFTPSMFNVTNISYVDIKNTSLVLAGQTNRTKLDCANITGAVSNLCTLTASGEESDPIWEGNSSIIFTNLSVNFTDIVYTNWNTLWSLDTATNETYRTVDNFTDIVTIQNTSILLSNNASINSIINRNQSLGAILQINNSGGLIWIDLNNASVNQIIGRNQTLNTLIQVNNTNLPVFNASYESCLNNASYLSTFNLTYDNKIDTFSGSNFTNVTSWIGNLSANMTSYAYNVSKNWTADTIKQINMTNDTYISINNGTANLNWTNIVFQNGSIVTANNATINFNWTNDVFRNSSLATNYNYTNDVFRNTSIVYITNTSYLTNLNTSLVLINNASLSTAYSHSQATTGTIHGLTIANVVSSFTNANGFTGTIASNALSLLYAENDTQWTKNATTTAQMNIVNLSLINATTIKVTETSGACDLTINHTICSNSSGTYIVG